MKYLIVTLISLCCIGCGTKQETQTDTAPAPTEAKTVEPMVIQAQSEPDTLKGSLKAMATGRIGSTFITIHYYSPAVRGRVIWGGLVPSDQVWVTGAHMATTIEFEGPVKIGDQEIPAGKYGFFTIPSSTEWTVILNKNWDQHLTDEYDQQDDIVRVVLKPEMLTDHQERLQYAVDSSAIIVRWEKIKISLPVAPL